MYAVECRAVAIGYDGADIRDILDGSCFNVAVSDSCAGLRGANVGFPFWIGHKKSARSSGYHCTAVEDRVGVVRGGMDVLCDCLCAKVVAVIVWVSGVVR